MDKNLEKLEADEEGAEVCESNRVPKQGSSAPAFSQARRILIVVRSSALVRKAHSSRNLILEVLFY
jgi:hypothetical protein